MNRVRELSADEEARRLAFVRERALYDEAMLLREAREEGMQQGEAATLLRLIERKFGAEAKEAYRARVEGAPEAELERWTDRIFTADRPEDLFG